jgi:hypothetical protein
VELGFDYCLKVECQQRCMKRVLLASVAVNKAADYYTKAEEMVPPRPPVSAPPTSIDADDEPTVRRRRPRPSREPRPTTALDRLHQAEADLDAALARSSERFDRGEVTAREMDRERDQLIEAFNQRVTNENIRYRSMLRSRSRRAG